MAAGYERFARGDLSEEEAAELSHVDRLASALRQYIAAREARIDEVHIHGASSSTVQNIIGELLTERLGFLTERVLTAEDGLVTRARPDFVYWLSRGRGILAEVERGGTTTNNHDLKDMWKAHISPDTQHLFLVVPRANWGEGGKARERPYPRVVQRVSAFFGDPRREVDVVSAHIFAYGRSG